MSTKHTPGPWHWVGNTLEPVEKNPASSAVYSILYADGGYGFIDSNLKATTAELDADRLLIAAAPELLQELQNIVNAKRFDRDSFPTDEAFIDWAQSRARAAIAKATGSQA